MEELVELQLENATLWILAVDLETLECEEVVASGFSRHGCRVQTAKLKTLNKHIGLRVAGFDKIIKGRITEILEDEVVVSFEYGDEPQTEKRKERRRPVAITAYVSGVEEQASVKCDIIDASLSGCRLSSNALYSLPDDIQLKIKGMDLPVRGKIMWRGAGVAGVKMLWDFTGKKEITSRMGKAKPAPAPTAPTAQNARAEGAARRGGSGFGVKRPN